MRFVSPAAHSEAVEVLKDRFGFRVVREEGLQTEMRRGAIHVVVRTYRERDRTVIRFHEDRFREGERHTVERSARLVRLGEEIKEALLERMRAGREPGRMLGVEAPRVEERCRFFDECPEAGEDRLCCRSSIYSELCEEYGRLMAKMIEEGRKRLGG
ncbi:MAG: hypothetical protein QXZ70_00630 [Candidatus Bathyarchaeia archaeon]